MLAPLPERGVQQGERWRDTGGGERQDGTAALRPARPGPARGPGDARVRMWRRDRRTGGKGGERLWHQGAPQGRPSASGGGGGQDRLQHVGRTAGCF